MHSSKIAVAFQKYYAQLSNLPNALPGVSDSTKTSCILNYLNAAQFPKLSIQVSCNLDTPIILEALGSVVKYLPKEKSPDPNGFTNAKRSEGSYLTAEP